MTDGLSIQKISIQNFEGIAFAEVDLASRCVLVLGANASGKTSFANAVRVLKALGLPDPAQIVSHAFRSVFNPAGRRPASFVDYLPWRRGGLVMNWRLSGAFGDDGFEYSISVGSDPNGRPVVLDRVLRPDTAPARTALWRWLDEIRVVFGPISRSVPDMDGVVKTYTEILADHNVRYTCRADADVVGERLLSEGMVELAGVMSAVLNCKSLLVLDEPFRSLNVRMADVAVEAIQNAARKSPARVVFLTGNPHYAVDWPPDDVRILDCGRVRRLPDGLVKSFREGRFDIVSAWMMDMLTGEFVVDGRDGPA